MDGRDDSVDGFVDGFVDENMYNADKAYKADDVHNTDGVDDADNMDGVDDADGVNDVNDVNGFVDEDQNRENGASRGNAAKPGGGAQGRAPGPAYDDADAGGGSAERTHRDDRTAVRRHASAVRRDAAVRAAVAQGLVGPDTPIVALLDVTGIRRSAALLRDAFAAVTPPGTPVLHAFAVKAAPLVPVLRLLREAGLGAEVASPGELALAGAAGIPTTDIVLDSPAKTPGELREALALGIAVNADNAQELARIDALLPAPAARAEAEASGAGAFAAGTPAPLGIRVNPQTGSGAIEALSTATATSKFGVALRDEGAREWVVRAYLDRPWLTRLHTHSGSQGVALELIAEGLAATYELAEEINAKAGRQQIDTIDIGGGLPVNFSSDEQTPTYAAYARLLAERVPGLFEGRYGLVTEFGRSLLAKHGVVLARVEYTKTSGGRPIAVTHAGVQVATRTVYAPESWPLRVAGYDADGLPRTGEEIAQDIAGPACFAGDLLARDRALPLLRPGDYAAVLDTGAYYFAHHYAYNSLPRPAVHGFTADDGTSPEGSPDGAAGTDGSVRFAVVRPAQTTEEIVAESGGAHVDSLVDGL